MSIGVIVPTHGRASRLSLVADNIHTSTESVHDVIFAIEVDDLESLEAAMEVGASVVVNGRTSNYAGAANSAYEQVGPAFDFLFAGADDVRFRLGWDIQALRKMDDQVHVVGTADLLNPYVAKGWHATHYLVDRRYLDDEGGVVDEGPGSFLFEGYSHNYTDTEFIGTAKARSRFRPCLDSVVEHMHFSNGKGEFDATSEKTRAGYEHDGQTYDARKHLWWDLSR